MLKIINNLAPFFEDCYRWISVREYGRMIDVSPPTASLLLKSYRKDGYLNSKEERMHLLFQLNRENKDIIDLSRIYWCKQLKDLVAEIEKKTINPTIILFGSLSKAEVIPNSDADIAIFCPDKKEINLISFQKRIHRNINLYWFNSMDDIKNEHLKKNILNGYLLLGRF